MLCKHGAHLAGNHIANLGNDRCRALSHYFNAQQLRNRGAERTRVSCMESQELCGPCTMTQRLDGSVAHRLTPLVDASSSTTCCVPTRAAWMKPSRT